MEYGVLSYEDEIAKGILRKYEIVYQYIGRFPSFGAKFGDVCSKTYDDYDPNKFIYDTPAGWQIRECRVYYVRDR